MDVASIHAPNSGKKRATCVYKRKSMCFCDFLFIFSYFKGLEKGVKSCYEKTGLFRGNLDLKY